MAKLILKSCKFRGTKVVDTASDPLETTWEGLCELLKENTKPELFQHLRRAQTGSYVGLILGAQTKKPVSFLLHNQGGTNDLGWLLKDMPDVTERVVSIYRVDAVEWDGQIAEESLPALEL